MWRFGAAVAVVFVAWAWRRLRELRARDSDDHDDGQLGPFGGIWLGVSGVFLG